jgi:membrane protease YdiL (CAAX protease family)
VSGSVEVVVVPFTEELVFRAVLLTALFAATRRLGFGSRAVALAVAIDAVAFGVAHGTNALSYEIGFVTLQVAFATLVGLGCAGLMARTRSVYPAMGLHAVVNAIVVVT